MTDEIPPRVSIRPSDGGVSRFRDEELVATANGISLYRAHDEQTDRSVLLRVADEATADGLLNDARRIAAVSHPNLVSVLAASLTATGSYAAVPELEDRPIGELASLPDDQAARVAIDIAGAIEALSRAGLRASVNANTVLVISGRDGARGLLDPLRSSAAAGSCLSESDPAASTRDLVGLLERVVPVPSNELRRVFESARNGTVSRPADLARGLSTVAAPRLLPARWRRMRLIAAGCAVALGALAVGLIVHSRSSNHPRATTAPRTSPAARIVATIPLGLPQSEGPAAMATVGHFIWIATNAGRLLHVDATTNQLVGGPVSVGPKHPLSDMTTSLGQLFTTDYAGWLLRIDPRTARVTGRVHLGKALTAIKASVGVLWVASDEDGTLLRIDAATLRRIGEPISALANPRQIEVRGSIAWVLGGAETGEVARVDARSAKRSVAYVGPQAIAEQLAGDTLWITDRYDGTVSPLSADRMVFSREAIHAQRSAFGMASVGPDLWVAVSSALGETGQMRVERFDTRTGRRVGTAVRVGTEGGRISLGAGSIWVSSRANLTRLAPTVPRPALAALARDTTSPRVLRAGPLNSGRWKSGAFAVPLTFSTPAFRWLAMFPQPDSAVFLGAAGQRAELNVSAPRQVFVNDRNVRPVPAPAALLKVLRANPRLSVGTVRHLVIGGRPALQFLLRARHAVRHPEVCGPQPCVLLFPIQEGTAVSTPGDVTRLTLLTSSGRTLVISENVDGYDRAALASTASLLKSFRFPA